ncbi:MULTISPECIES: MauE/DoxX family redox-associated membrane protein [Corynebacterium]|uniref:MauE/DoxX family redox-associated membrane protein n=1 Tax=Corynebacterium TaxID=1716 RepID=UPI0008A2224D|nr:MULTISPECIES: MauE/DoxX family redox-associated membrane protein [Corynebacterium]MCG7438577.1 DoxX family membrane protein [Corynebacterium freneyi]OFU54749.1 DoxX family protein [Corynebacterium sp. HMSC11E11]
MNAAISAIARFGLAAVWLWSGTVKLLNPLDSRQAIAAYELLPGGMIDFLAVALPAVELILGLMLLIGVFLRWAAVASSIILVGFIVGVGSAWARGLSIDCGCFGGGGYDADAGPASYLTSIGRDLVFLAMAAWTAWRPFERFAVRP